MKIFGQMFGDLEKGCYLCRVIFIKTICRYEERTKKL